MVRLFDQGAKAFSTLAERTKSNGNGPYSMASEAGEAAKSLGEIARHWVAEPGKLAAAQGELFRELCRSVGPFLPPVSRRGGRARGRARARRQPLQGPRLVQRAVLRFLEAGLSHHLALGRGPHPQHRGRRREDAQEGAVLPEPDAGGGVAVELPPHQPGSGPHHARDQRRESGAGHDPFRPRSRAVEGSAAHQPDRSLRLRDRTEPRGDAGQGRVPERPDPAHPIRAGDGGGL